ncbi:perlucin-like protein [Malaya genurostris]|uniref:perlucin-like protein n=1 Tax=Malaya genurostris TaxID=325434 RepID=UPI0026F38693|nr:perlucin-like protein [Malaya genurostris]
MQFLFSFKFLHSILWIQLACSLKPLDINKYVIINDNATFFEAWRGCQYYGQRLASITSQEDSELVAQVINSTTTTNSTYWVAGTDIGMEGKWIWITSNELVVKFSHWGHISPDNSNVQDCMTVGHFPEDRTLWDDVDCETPNYYICERLRPKPVDKQ